MLDWKGATTPRPAMIKLRNPWGSNSSREDMWTGVWCSDCQEWLTLSEEERSCFVVEPGDGGVFWMPWAPFCKYFEELTVC